MTGLAINVGPISATAELRSVPLERWRELMYARRDFAAATLPYDCRCLLQFANDADEMHAELGFDTPEAMISDGLGFGAAELRLVVEWLELHPQADAVPLETAKAMALQAHGGDRRRSADQADNVRLETEYGNAKAYTLARLRRDRPDLAERVEAGELSAHAAAIEAGFRHRQTPFEIILQQLKKLDAAERARLIEIIEEADMNEAGEQHGQRQRLKMALEGTQ